MEETRWFVFTWLESITYPSILSISLLLFRPKYRCDFCIYNTMLIVRRLYVLLSIIVCVVFLPSIGISYWNENLKLYIQLLSILLPLVGRICGGSSPSEIGKSLLPWRSALALPTQREAFSRDILVQCIDVFFKVATNMICGK